MSDHIWETSWPRCQPGHKTLTPGSLRDHLSVMELTEIGVTEYLATGLHVNRDSDGRDELSEDIEDTRPILDAARPEIEKAFSKKRPNRK